MLCIRHQRKVLPCFAVLVSLFVTCIFIAGIVIFKKFRVDSVARSTFIALILFCVSCVIIVGLCVYCTVVYGRIHRLFLLAVTLVFTLAVGVLAFAVFSYTDVILEWAGTLWAYEDASAAEALEEWFGCKGWSTETNNTTCESVIKDFLDKNSKKVSTAIGFLFLVFLFCTFFGFYIVCNSTWNTQQMQHTERIDDLSFRSDIDTQLNPEGGEKELIF